MRIADSLRCQRPAGTELGELYAKTSALFLSCWKYILVNPRLGNSWNAPITPSQYMLTLNAAQLTDPLFRLRVPALQLHRRACRNLVPAFHARRRGACSAARTSARSCPRRILYRPWSGNEWVVEAATQGNAHCPGCGILSRSRRDLAKWKVHGQVRSVKTSFAECYLAAEEWRGPRYHIL